MIAAITEAPTFRAKLESSTGTVFVSGELDPYGLATLRESAGHAVDRMRIRVEGLARAEAESLLSRSLASLLRRGVHITVSAN